MKHLLFFLMLLPIMAALASPARAQTAGTDELTSTVTAMARVGRAFAPSFSPDGSQIAFISDLSGVNLDNGKLRVNGVRDIKSTVEHLVQTGIADAKKVGIMGGSYGGYMTMAGLTEFPDLFAAGADLYGIFNFETFFKHTEPWMAAISTVEYGDPATEAEMLRSLSPIHRVDRITAPTMVLHGANDTNVPVVEAEQVVEMLKKRNVPVEYVIFPDEGHGWRKVPNRIRSTLEITKFFVSHLKAGAPPASSQASSPTPLNEALRQELRAMGRADHAEGNMQVPAQPPAHDWEGSIREQNVTRLRGIIQEYGWPGNSLVGRDGARAAWVIAQHADFDVPFQKECLTLIQAAYLRGDVDGHDLAYLTDRIATMGGRPAVYGTMGADVHTPEEEAAIDARRRQVGLPSLAEFRAMIARGEYWRVHEPTDW